MKVLVTYHCKDTDKYKRFESYSLNDSLTMEVLQKHVDTFNKQNKEEYIVIHNEDWLGEITEDITHSYSYESFIERMEDISKEIRDISCSMSYCSEEILDTFSRDKLRAIRDFCLKNPGDPMTVEILSIIED